MKYYIDSAKTKIAMSTLLRLILLMAICWPIVTSAQDGPVYTTVTLDPATGFPDKAIPFDEPFILRFTADPTSIKSIYIQRNSANRCNQCWTTRQNEAGLTSEILKAKSESDLDALGSPCLFHFDPNKVGKRKIDGADKADKKRYLELVFDGSEISTKCLLQGTEIDSVPMLDRYFLREHESVKVFIETVEKKIDYKGLFAVLGTDFSKNPIKKKAQDVLNSSNSRALSLENTIDSLELVYFDYLCDLTRETANFCWLPKCHGDLCKECEQKSTLQDIGWKSLIHNSYMGSDGEDRQLWRWARGIRAWGETDLEEKSDTAKRSRFRNYENSLKSFNILRRMSLAAKSIESDSSQVDCVEALGYAASYLSSGIEILGELVLAYKEAIEIDEVIDNQLYVLVPGDAFKFKFQGAASGGIAELKSRQENWINGEVGLVASYAHSGFQTLVPYMGLSVGFRPTNKRIPLKVGSYPGLRNWKGQRYSFSIGYSLTKYASGIEDAMDLIDKGSILTTFGYRLSHTAKIVAGSIWHYRTNPNPIVSERQLQTDFVVGLSFDLRVSDWVSEIKNAFQ